MAGDAAELATRLATVAPSGIDTSNSLQFFIALQPTRNRSMLPPALPSHVGRANRTTDYLSRSLRQFSFHFASCEGDLMADAQFAFKRRKRTRVFCRPEKAQTARVCVKTRALILLCYLVFAPG